MDDFTTVVEEIRRSNAEEAKRDRYRLEQATAHSQKNSQLLEKALDNKVEINLDEVSDAIEDQTSAFVGPLQASADMADSQEPPSVQAAKDDERRQDQKTLVNLLMIDF